MHGGHTMIVLKGGKVGVKGVRLGLELSGNIIKAISVISYAE